VITEGERWAREELAALLAARFTPVAIARFLVRSQRRASDVRAARPALARQSRVWIAAGCAGWIVPALLGVEPFRRRLRFGVAWWASSAVMFDWHLGMVEEEDGRPVLLGAPDACTLLRVWLVPVAADAAHPGAVGVAAATDVLDGRLARASRTTRAGRDLEGLADTCFASATLVGARRSRGLSRGAVAAELGRLGIGFAYALATYFGRAAVRAPTSAPTRPSGGSSAAAATPCAASSSRAANGWTRMSS